MNVTPKNEIAQNIKAATVRLLLRQRREFLSNFG
jgi:hypothetical protein